MSDRELLTTEAKGPEHLRPSELELVRAYTKDGMTGSMVPLHQLVKAVQEIDALMADLAHKERWLEQFDLTPKGAPPEPSVATDAASLLRSLLSYTKSCEGLLNAAPAGQVLAAEAFLANAPEPSAEHSAMERQLRLAVMNARHDLAALIPTPSKPTTADWPCENEADRECLQSAYQQLAEVEVLTRTPPEPSGECKCIPMAPRPWKFCQDCGGRISETKEAKPLDMSGQPMGDPHPLDLAKNGQCAFCGSSTGDNCPHCDTAHQADLRAERLEQLRQDMADDSPLNGSEQ